MTRGITAAINFSDIPILDNIVANVGIVAGKNLIIDALRECFSRDREYSYRGDIFGFPKTPPNLGLDEDAGIADNTTTRLFIGAAFRYDVSYTPALIVRQTSTVYRPVSFNQNKWNIQYETQRMVDGYGLETFIEVPSRYSFAGFWEQTFEVKIVSKSLEDTNTLADIVLASLQTTYRDVLQQCGLFIKQVRSNGEQSENIGAKDPLFTQTISIDALSEWRREIPISNLVERIQFCFSFDVGSIDNSSSSEHFKGLIS
jgi:hypothetical protein